MINAVSPKANQMNAMSEYPAILYVFSMTHTNKFLRGDN